MSFESLNQVLTSIQQQPAWAIQQQYQLVKQLWTELVKPEVALQTRPLYITRQVLKVATSSAVLAQDLALKRYSLLKKINTVLPESLVDIHFSTANWYKQNTNETSQENPISLESHPSFIVPLNKSNQDLKAQERYINTIRSRLEQMPLCPQCQSPTPVGELNRWSICAYCASKLMK